MLGKRPRLLIALLGAASITTAGMGWMFYRNYPLFSTAQTERHSLSPLRSAQQNTQQTRQAPLELDNITTFTTGTLASNPLITAPPEPTLDNNFRELITPPGSARVEPALDPRALRALMDRGVVTFASAATNMQRKKGAELIQTSALLGFTPARRLLVRNYSQYEPVRQVVPAADVIRYAADIFATSAIDADSKEIFLTLSQYFAGREQLEFFVTNLLEGFRGDARPQLSYRIDTLLEELARAPGACLTIARTVLPMKEVPVDECSPEVSGALRKFIEVRKPIDREADSKQRGLKMLSPN
jgi:hypothetical protein